MSDKMDRMGRGMEKIVKEGWEDKSSNAESPEELLKSAVFALRRDIDKVRHQFENTDGSVRQADPKGGTGSFKTIEDVNAWHEELVKQCREQRTLLSDALVEVEHEVLPGEKEPTIQYLNQVGGAYNYVADRLLGRASDKVASVEDMESLLHNFMPLFFHVSGWERFTEEVERRTRPK